MTTTVHRFPLPRRWDHRRLAGSLAALALGIAACGYDNSQASSPALGEQATTTTISGRPSELVDDAVAIDGGKMYLRCVGEGDTTAVLIAGFNDDGSNWSTVAPPLAESARVCWYSRFGTGDSDPASKPQTFTSQAGDLNALLQAASEPGPYLLVGHSYGGAQAVAFASLFPASVRGLLLIDASPPEWDSAICAVTDDGSDAAADLRGFCDDVADPSRNPERLDGPAAFAEIAAIRSLGSLPLTVLTAGSHPFPGLARAEEARLNEAWNAGQDHWTSLSSASELIRVDQTSHYIQLDQPAAVIEQIRRLLP